MTTLKIAAAAWPIERHADWDGFAAKAERWVKDAGDAAVLLFPEYGSMELTALVPHGGDLHQSLGELQGLWPRFCELWAGLAERYRVTIVAPSFPVREDGRFVNRAAVFAHGLSSHQDKLHMTRFEAEDWGISAGHGLTLFEIGPVTAGVAICYDVEFPDQVQALSDAGADLILVPSCTDTDAGYTRVSISARARAIENQCFVAMASTAGNAPWSPAVDSNTGTGGIYGPADRGFPADGILAQGAYNTPGWTFATLDFDALAAVRRTGQVLNHRDRAPIAYGSPKRTP